MRFLKISLFFFLFTITIYSQKGWEKQVSGTTEHLNGLYFIDTNHGFIVGNNGTLLRTTDSGTKWEKQSTGTSNDLSSISFVDLQNGFIWGSNKTFLRTKDGGATWHNLSDSLVDGIVPYAFLDANTALGVKEGWDSITVFKTINNGLSWERLSSLRLLTTGATSQPTQKIYYLDHDNIILIYRITALGYILKSTDGGKSWNLAKTVGTGQVGGFVDASFINTNTGLMIDLSGRSTEYKSIIFRTNNGGNSWQELITLPKCQSIYMIDENNGYIVGNTAISLNVAKRSAIYKTTDGGISWVLLSTNPTYVLNAVFFTDVNNGTIIGENGLIIRTKTGGITNESSTWKIQNSGVSYDLGTIILIDRQTGYINGSRILKTKDGGINWLKLDSGGLEDINFADSLNGMEVGTHNLVYSTKDGAKSWQKIIFNDELWIAGLGVYCIDYYHRVIVGAGGAIRYTSDGGETWLKINSGVSLDLNLTDVFFLDSNIGFIVGDDGIVLRTVNGGLTWTRLNTNTTIGLKAVYFTNINNGIAVGLDGYILRTIDGGETWQIENSGTANNLYSVSFMDKNNGLIVGESGVILRTVDSGKNWNIEPSGISETLYGVAIKYPVELAAGAGGVILRNITNVIPEVDDDPFPTPYNLDQNYPNPFNPGTNISFQILEPGYVTLKVYDLLGRELATLVNEEKIRGNYEIPFNGSGFSSGLYFYILNWNNSIQTKKMLLIK